MDICFYVSCACPAGPAFEGEISVVVCVQPDGAIEACTIDKETMEPTYSIIGEERAEARVGLCAQVLLM